MEPQAHETGPTLPAKAVRHICAIYDSNKTGWSRLNNLHCVTTSDRCNVHFLCIRLLYAMNVIFFETSNCGQYIIYKLNCQSLICARLCLQHRKFHSLSYMEISDTISLYGVVRQGDLDLSSALKQTLTFLEYSCYCG